MIKIWKMTFDGYQPPDLKRIRIKMIDLRDKAKEFDKKRLNLTALRNHHLNRLDEICEEIDKIKAEESEVHDKYLEIYDDFKDCQAYYLDKC